MKFIALLIIAIMVATASTASAQDCQSCQSGDVKVRKFVPMAFVQQSRVAGKVRYRHGQRVDKRSHRTANRRGC